MHIAVPDRRAATAIALTISLALAIATGPAAADPLHGKSPAAKSGSVLAVPGKRQHGVASYYADRFEGRRTASGEVFDNDELTAAHPTLPLGTRVRVTDPATGRAVIVRVNDRGPYVAGRAIDLSQRAGAALGILDDGLARVTIEVLSTPSG